MVASAARAGTSACMTGASRQPAPARAPRPAWAPIGILGGSGPAATARLLTTLVAAAQRDYGAVQDSDFPTVLVHSVPLPGMGADGHLAPALARAGLDEGLAGLVRTGAHVLAVACNTLHHELAGADLHRRAHDVPAAGGATRAEVVDLVAVTARAARDACPPGAPVGVLCSTAARRAELYPRQLAGLGVASVDTTEAEQALVTTVIGQAMAGIDPAGQAETIAHLVGALRARGAGAVILGCTELAAPPAYRGPGPGVTGLGVPGLGVPVLDSVHVLAGALLARSAARGRTASDTDTVTAAPVPAGTARPTTTQPHQPRAAGLALAAPVPTCVPVPS